jgi:hypothetical protein
MHLADLARQIGVSYWRVRNKFRRSEKRPETVFMQKTTALYIREELEQWAADNFD